MSLTIAGLINKWVGSVHNRTSFIKLATENPQIKNLVINDYRAGHPADTVYNTKPLRFEALKNSTVNIPNSIDDLKLYNKKFLRESFDPTDVNQIRGAANWVYNKGPDYIRTNIYGPAAEREIASSRVDTTTIKNSETSEANNLNIKGSSPFDRRLFRLEQAYELNNAKATGLMPYSTDFAEISTTGYLMDYATLKDKPDFDKKGEMLEKLKSERAAMSKDDFYKGVPSLQNYYALVRLYGSEGGKLLINQKNQRKWYELDTTSDNQLNITSTPTTSALISWGQGDPYGRTPYQFTDFVFSKYWNKIPNNRLITLRRYAAPILDNLKFPGMNATSENNSPATAFPPMATAITYFGGDSGNNLNNIIKFTTGVQWEEIQGDVWSVTADTVDSRSGPGAIWGGLASFAEILGVASGQVSIDNILNQGQLPPDPYDNGPYENRVMGPINRIDKVMKRKAGMAFEWDGLNLVFEYVARPVGGINPKAVLLDILSNFLVMGSASAQFFGGAHRFMANPAKYPFMGGQAGIEKWYKGDFLGWGIETINQFTSPGTGVSTIAGNVLENFQAALSKIFSGDGFDIVGAFSTLMSGASGKIIGAQLARRSGGQIPYLTGLKAILTGEPVGEWHITIGNPLNPIAMIGNLICEGITVEFNEELGPDDFPTEMKITVKLKHAMARDRDAIESVFNRGMGRIYSLPESFKGSADFTTGVDKVTEKDLKDGTTGQVPNQTFGIKYTGRGGRYINPKQIEGSKLSIVSDETSVWNRASFNFGISANSSQQFVNELNNNIIYSSYRAADWIAQRALI
jgi:hypothetical protein